MIESVDLFSGMHLTFRWLHVFAGIVWIGHLYFFNFVNVPFQGAIDDAAKKAVNAKLLLRALWWFRWGAMITFLAGVVLFVLNYWYTPGLGLGPSALFTSGEGITHRAMWILFGMTLAVIMWFNVWFIIWPAQKKLLTGLAKPEEAPGLRKRALLASRANTYLSAPMLFGMLAPAHFGVMESGSFLFFVALALAAIWWAIAVSFNVAKN
ncbi:MAG: urate hydroxylase PuuD [Elusimicrobia bacterium]|nr:urate hydroxylase PuuD [Elusimicrobiota bacterium]